MTKSWLKVDRTTRVAAIVLGILMIPMFPLLVVTGVEPAGWRLVAGPLAGAFAIYCGVKGKSPRA